MKKRIVLVLLITVLLSVSVITLAAVTIGPGVTVTLRSAVKYSSPYYVDLVISKVNIESAEPYICWVTNNACNAQVTPTYYVHDRATGSKKYYYMTESINAGKVNIGNDYSFRSRSNPNTQYDEVGEIDLSSFVP